MTANETIEFGSWVETHDDYTGASQDVADACASQVITDLCNKSLAGNEDVFIPADYPNNLCVMFWLGYKYREFRQAKELNERLNRV